MSRAENNKADINNITIQAPTYPYSPNSSAAKREYVKNNEVTDLVKQLKPTQVKRKYIVLLNTFKCIV
jgi:hypothetical protein